MAKKKTKKVAKKSSKKVSKKKVSKKKTSKKTSKKVSKKVKLSAPKKRPIQDKGVPGINIPKTKLEELKNHFQGPESVLQKDLDVNQVQGISGEVDDK